MRFLLSFVLAHFLHHANALLGSFPVVSRPRLSYHTPLKTYRHARSIAIFEDDDFPGQTGQWPYSDADLGRVDSSNDSRFYDTPRLVTHIDNQAIAALTSYYAEELRSGNDVLDICSSWISHLPEKLPLGRVAGLGMNAEELARNDRLTEFVTSDLNQDPRLPYDDESFDVVNCVVSVDYLTQPREVFQEIYRVLRPQGKCLISFSNRCFPTKAVAMWLQADDIGRMTIVASYFHYSAAWKSIEALDIKPPNPPPPRPPSAGDIFATGGNAAFSWVRTTMVGAKEAMSDPMFVIKGIK